MPQCDLGSFGYVFLIDEVRVPAGERRVPKAIPGHEQGQYDQRLAQLPGCALPGRQAPLGYISAEPDTLVIDP